MRLLVGDDVGLGHDVDTIEELTDILVLHQALVVDGGSLLGDLLQIVALNHELVLGHGGVGTVDLEVGGDGDLAHTLLTKEVTDLDHVALHSHVDGEMGAGEAELEAEATGHAGDHVADVGEGGVQAGDVSLVSEPADGGDGLHLLGDGEVELQVAQGLHKGAAGALDGHNTILDGGENALGDLHGGERLDLHSLPKKIKVMK